MQSHSRNLNFSLFATLFGIWALLFIFATRADVRVANWVVAHHPIDKKSLLCMTLKAPGVFYLTMAIAAALFFRHPLRGRAAALPLVSGALGGLAYLVLKWIVGRHRPHPKEIQFFTFHPFIHGMRGLFHESNLSFPSGHTTLAFATAASLSILLPRWKPVWFLIAALTGCERVLEGAHYASDVVAGAGLGIICTLVSWHFVRAGAKKQP